MSSARLTALFRLSWPWLIGKRQRNTEDAAVLFWHVFCQALRGFLGSPFEAVSAYGVLLLPFSEILTTRKCGACYSRLHIGSSGQASIQNFTALML